MDNILIPLTRGDAKFSFFVYDEDEKTNDFLCMTAVKATLSKNWDGKLTWRKCISLRGEDLGEIFCSVVLYDKRDEDVPFLSYHEEDDRLFVLP